VYLFIVKKVNFQWDDDEVHLVLDQHVDDTVEDDTDVLPLINNAVVVVSYKMFDRTTDEISAKFM
jgi:hypothetical protein